MICIKNVTLCNFLSTGNCTQHIRLHDSPLTLILGENLDSGSGIDRNGAGKTTILQATSYALYGDALTKITLDNLCNTYNVKGMLVTVDFERDGKAYRIERGRKPNVLRWFVDGLPKDNAQGENKQTQAEIERVVGMSHTMFRHIIALNTYTTPFLREKASEQREIIEELLGITQLSQRAEALKKLIDATKEGIRDQEATVKANCDANARIQQAIDRAKTDADVWRAGHERHVADLRKKAAQLGDIDFDRELEKLDQIDSLLQRRQGIFEQTRNVEQQIGALDKEIARRQDDLSHYNADSITSTAEIQRLEQQAERYREQAQDVPQSQIYRLLSEAKRQRKIADDKYNEAAQLAADIIGIQEQIDNPDDHRCPTCGQGLVGTEHALEVTARLTAQVEQLTNRASIVLTESDQCKSYASEIDEDIIDQHTKHEAHRIECLEKILVIEQEITTIETLREEKQTLAKAKVAEMQTLIDQLIEQRKECQARMGTLTTALDDLDPTPISFYGNRNSIWKLRQDFELLVNQITTETDKPNPHTTKIEGLAATLMEIDYQPLNELSLNFKHESFLHKLLTAKDSFVRKKIVDQNLRYLNQRLDYYIERLGLPHEVRFLPDLTVEISLLGRDFDFEQLSRGEMNRLILATAWAFRDCWENLNAPCNLLFIDEMLDSGLDDAGVEAAWAELQDMARRKNIFVVSHKANLVGRADRILMVRKEANFTNFAEAA